MWGVWEMTYWGMTGVLPPPPGASTTKVGTQKLESSGIEINGASENDLTAEGVIYRMAQAVLDGNSHFYITLEGQDQIFDVPVTEFPEIVGYDLGDQISLRYVQGDRICTVTQLEGQEPQKDSSDSEDDQGKSQDTEETEAS